jgi:hypothetical protein
VSDRESTFEALPAAVPEDDLSEAAAEHDLALQGGGGQGAAPPPPVAGPVPFARVG